jgi:outer membrane protein TolC
MRDSLGTAWCAAAGLRQGRGAGLVLGSSIWAAAVLLSIAALTLHAETLDEAWAAALASDKTLQAAALRIDAADASLAAARAERRPTVAATGMLMRFDTTPAFDFSGVGVPAQLPLVGGESWLMSDARVSVPIYAGGGIGAGIDAAAAQLSTRESEAGALTLDVKLGVAESYIAVLRAESALSVATANVSSLSAHASDVEDMFTSGQVPRNDFLAASVTLADARQAQLRARSALDIARAAYNRNVGRDLSAAVSLDPALPPADPALTSGSFGELLDLALANRQELERLSAAVAGLQAQSVAAGASGRPQIMVSGGYTKLENDFLNRDDFWSVGLNVQWQFFDGGRSRNAATMLTRQAAAASRERANLETLIELAVRQAWLDVDETRQRIGVTEAAVAQAEENLRVVRDRYRNGEGTNTEVLDAEALWLASRSNFDAAHCDAALAELRLARAVGTL